MRTRRHIGLALLGVFALVSAACAGDDAATSSTTTEVMTGAAVSIASPADGAVIKGNVVTLNLKVTGLDIVAADGDTSGESGHLHVFVDQEPVAVGAAIPKAPGIIHSVDNPIVVPGLSVGQHTLTVRAG